MQIRFAQIKDPPPPSGGFQNTTVVTTSPYNLLGSDEVLFVNPDTLGSDITLNLPVGDEGRPYTIIHTGSDSHNIFIVPNGAEKLFGDNSSFKVKRGEKFNIIFSSSEGWW